MTCSRAEASQQLAAPSWVSAPLSSTLLGRCSPRTWYAACTSARFVAIVDVAIILGGILLVAWLVDGQAS
jgi:hypothetical protein